MFGTIIPVEILFMELIEFLLIETIFVDIFDKSLLTVLIILLLPDTTLFIELNLFFFYLCNCKYSFSELKTLINFSLYTVSSKFLSSTYSKYFIVMTFFM